MAKQYINPGPLEFDGEIKRNTEVDNSSAWIEFPYDLKETFGMGNLVPFVATFDGRVEYRGSLAKMGGPSAMLLLRKDVRAQIGKQPGDTVHVRFELDDKPREIAVPADVTVALKASKQLEYFKSLAFSHRREYIRWIEEAKRPETRMNRIQKMSEMLAAGKKDPR